MCCLCRETTFRGAGKHNARLLSNYFDKIDIKIELLKNKKQSLKIENKWP